MSLTPEIIPLTLSVEVLKEFHDFCQKWGDLGYEEILVHAERKPQRVTRNIRMRTDLAKWRPAEPLPLEIPEIHKVLVNLVGNIVSPPGMDRVSPGIGHLAVSLKEFAWKLRWTTHPRPDAGCPEGQVFLFHGTAREEDFKKILMTGRKGERIKVIGVWQSIIDGRPKNKASGEGVDRENTTRSQYN